MKETTFELNTLKINQNMIKSKITHFNNKESGF